jgi:hypothetical protein
MQHDSVDQQHMPLTPFSSTLVGETPEPGELTHLEMALRQCGRLSEIVHTSAATVTSICVNAYPCSIVHHTSHTRKSRGTLTKTAPKFPKQTILTQQCLGGWRLSCSHDHPQPRSTKSINFDLASSPLAQSITTLQIAHIYIAGAEPPLWQTHSPLTRHRIRYVGCLTPLYYVTALIPSQ